jgi:hypothetical protein
VLGDQVRMHWSVVAGHAAVLLYDERGIKPVPPPASSTLNHSFIPALHFLIATLTNSCVRTHLHPVLPQVEGMCCCIMCQCCLRARQHHIRAKQARCGVIIPLIITFT